MDAFWRPWFWKKLFQILIGPGQKVKNSKDRQTQKDPKSPTNIADLVIKGHLGIFGGDSSFRIVKIDLDQS